MKKDKIVVRENQDGIVVAKWKSKRVVSVLTKHNLIAVNTGRKNRHSEQVMNQKLLRVTMKGSRELTYLIKWPVTLLHYKKQSDDIIKLDLNFC